MAGKSPRDKCFGEAVDAWNETHPNDRLPVDNQTPWVLDNGKWRPAGKLEQIWNWIRGGEPYRVPDWTAVIDGVYVAGDNKFEGDGYSKRTGRSGKTQLEDQNDMNRHQSPDKPEYQDLNLNPEKCKCGDGEPQRETVYEYETMAGKVYVPLPSMGPGGVTIPELPPIPSLPEPMPIPEFIFP